jgi:hypothetical protein
MHAHLSLSRDASTIFELKLFFSNDNNLKLEKVIKLVIIEL